MELMITQHDGIIEENFEEAKNYLASQLEAYKTVVFTEETKKDAKDTIAQLRKDKKGLQDRVKEVKKEYMKPLDEFIAKANELMGLYDEPITLINEQVNAFEEKRRAEKIEAVKAIYTELVPEEEWQQVIPFNKIFNPKWENATTTAKAIKEEIMRYKEHAKLAYTTIKAMHSDKEVEALEMFNRNLNLNECIDYLEQYEQQKKEVLEREREREKKEAEERIRAEERAKMLQEQAHAQAVEQAKEEAVQETINSLTPTDVDAEVKPYSYIIKLSDEAKEKLEMYMDSVGIEYLNI